MTSCKRAVPLVLAALLVFGASDDAAAMKDGVDVVQTENDSDLRIDARLDDEDDMIVVGELALYIALIIWALFGPGAKGRRQAEPKLSENRQ